MNGLLCFVQLKQLLHCAQFRVKEQLVLLVKSPLQTLTKNLVDILYDLAESDKRLIDIDAEVLVLYHLFRLWSFFIIVFKKFLDELDALN